MEHEYQHNIIKTPVRNRLFPVLKKSEVRINNRRKLIYVQNLKKLLPTLETNFSVFIEIKLVQKQTGIPI